MYHFPKALLGLVGLPLGLSLSCSDRPTASQCFPEDPWVDDRAAAEEFLREGGPLEEYHLKLANIGFCEYESDEIFDIFPEYEPREIDTFYVCEPSESCGECDVNAVDLTLEQWYLNAQRDRGCPEESLGILEYERGCEFESVDEEGEPVCCHSAVVAARCTVQGGPPSYG